MKNSLAGGLNCSVPVAEEIIKAAKLGPTARAQELSLPEWERLYKAALKRELL
jgi:hypothetical protein